MENEFRKLAKYMATCFIILIIYNAFVPNFFLAQEISELKKEVTKTNNEHKKSVVAFGDGWEIRLKNTENYYSNCEELKEALIAIYGYLQAKDSINSPTR